MPAYLAANHGLDQDGARGDAALLEGAEQVGGLHVVLREGDHPQDLLAGRHRVQRPLKVKAVERVEDVAHAACTRLKGEWEGGEGQCVFAEPRFDLKTTPR